MLARIWHGVTLTEKADEYLDYLNRTGIPDYRATPGNRGAFVLRHVDGERAHFHTQTGVKRRCQRFKQSSMN